MSPQRKQYADYIKSKAWQKKRGKVIFRDAGQCKAIKGDKLCGSHQNLEVHHLTYERFGNELLSDLVTVCEDCHKAIHAQQTA